MLNLLQRKIHKHVICLLANSSKADKIGAGLMENLYDVSEGNIEFIGAGGSAMMA
jgi:hypothetical protein